MSVRFKRAGAGYFETLGIPMIAGRTFTDADRFGTPWVTVINDALAAQLKSAFGMNDPIGQIVDLPAIGYGSPTTRERMTVIAIRRNHMIVWPHQRNGPYGDALLADVEMQEAADFPGWIMPPRLLLKAPNPKHVAKEACFLIRRERLVDWC